MLSETSSNLITWIGFAIMFAPLVWELIKDWVVYYEEYKPVNWTLLITIICIGLIITIIGTASTIIIREEIENQEKLIEENMLKLIGDLNCNELRELRKSTTNEIYLDQIKEEFTFECVHIEDF